MKKLLLALMPCISAFGADSSLDLIASMGGKSFQGKGNVEFDHLLSGSYLESSVFLNSSVKPTFDGDIHSSMGIGSRSDVKSGIVGIHFYVDHSYISEEHYFQTGPSFEFSTKRWDLRANGYFPLAVKPVAKNNGISVHDYFDASITYKRKYMAVSVMPCYSLTKEKYAVAGKISIPVGFSILSVTAGRDCTQGKFAILSISCNIFNSAEENTFNAPVERQTGVFYTKECVREDESEFFVNQYTPTIVMSSDDQKGPTITVKRQDKPTTGSWWNFFLGSESTEKNVDVIISSKTPN